VDTGQSLSNSLFIHILTKIINITFINFITFLVQCCYLHFQRSDKFHDISAFLYKNVLIFVTLKIALRSILSGSFSFDINQGKIVRIKESN